MKITTEDFITRAKATHGDKYDYSSTVYIKAHSKLTIICPEHGPFQQIAKDHYKYGCKQCAIESRGKSRRMTTQQFIDKAIKVHGESYSYHLVNYEGDNKTPVEIVCPEHGVFMQKPNGHLRGEGCPRCARESASKANLMSVDEFVNRSIEIHGDKYNYNEVEYVNSVTPVTIICPEHGSFQQKPVHHIRGAGCKNCYYESVKGPRMTTQQFIDKAIMVHGDKFNYNKTKYEGTHEQLTINCPDHGDFRTKAIYHLQGQGCPHCAVYGFNSEKEGVLYILVAADKTKMKIGITNDIDRRLNELRRRTPFDFHLAATRCFEVGHKAVSCEKYLHGLYENCKLKEFDGATEWYILDFNVINKMDSYESD